MFLLIFKSIVRLFGKNKLIFTLSLLGLSVGFAVFITIFMYVRFEYSFDNFQPDAKNIYRMHPTYGVNGGYINEYATSDNAYGPTLRKELPEILNYVRMLAYQSERMVTYSPENRKKIQNRESQVFIADSNFFSFFRYRLKEGSPTSVLVRPGTIVISESAAVKYFGEEDPIGKQLIVSDYGEPYKCEVTGIFYDLPANSNLRFNFLISFESLKQRNSQIDNSWNFGVSYTYLRLAENTDIRKLEKDIMDVFKARSGYVIPGNLKFDMNLVSMADIHLNPPLQWELEKKGDRSETRYLYIIAIMILSVSWLNYLNISTSLGKQRARNSRVKTILGSGKLHLIIQFMAEAFVVNLVSLLIAIQLIIPGQTLISSFFGSDAAVIIFQQKLFPVLLLSILGFGTLITGILSSVIFFLSNPDFLLNLNNKASRPFLRQIMVVTQFASGIILIIGTLVIFKQVRFLKMQDTGVNLKQTIVIKAPSGTDAHTEGIDKFRRLLSNTAGIEHVSAGSDIPGQFMDMGYLVHRTAINPPVYQVTDGGRIDHEYCKSLGLKIIAGEDFAEGMDTEHKVLINEEMVKLLKFESNDDAIGKPILLPEVYGNMPVTVLGVLQNYRQQSPVSPYRPVFFMCRAREWLKFNYFIVQYNGPKSRTLDEIASKWKEAFPLSTFDYYFLDDYYNRQYSGSIRFGQLFGLLSLLAIIISVLGLFGLSVNTTQNRIKEIGIRKVNGAKILQILYILNRDIAIWVIVAILIASPIAWYAMNLWLKTFATRTSLDWWIFALAAAATMTIALLTVSWQSWRAAKRNPVESLRYE
jgi:putative ABC transport system permease protein